MHLSCSWAAHLCCPTGAEVREGGCGCTVGRSTSGTVPPVLLLLLLPGTLPVDAGSYALSASPSPSPSAMYTHAHPIMCVKCHVSCACPLPAHRLLRLAGSGPRGPAGGRQGRVQTAGTAAAPGRQPLGTYVRTRYTSPNSSSPCCRHHASLLFLPATHHAHTHAMQQPWLGPQTHARPHSCMPPSPPQPSSAPLPPRLPGVAHDRPRGRRQASADEDFMALRRAYVTLSTAELRAEYDSKIGLVRGAVGRCRPPVVGCQGSRQPLGVFGFLRLSLQSRPAFFCPALVPGPCWCAWSLWAEISCARPNEPSPSPFPLPPWAAWTHPGPGPGPTLDPPWAHPGPGPGPTHPLPSALCLPRPCAAERAGEGPEVCEV